MTILNADFTLCISVCTGFKSFFRESKLQFYFLIFSKKVNFTEILQIVKGKSLYCVIWTKIP